MNDRCPWAIRYHGRLHTRCVKPEHARGDSHMGRGESNGSLPTRIFWTWLDTRSYRTQRSDPHAWESDR